MLGACNSIKPREYDVMFGRGKRSNKHPGNVNMRSVVGMFKSDFQRAPRSRKQLIVNNVIQLIKSCSPPKEVRYFIKTARETGDDCSWREATSDETRKKIAHGLRAKGNSQNVAQGSMHNIENKTADEPQLELDDFVDYYDHLSLLEPCEYDVMFGRGKRSNKHPGNVNMRSVVGMFKSDFQRAPRSRKQLIVNNVIQLIKSCSPTEEVRYFIKTARETGDDCSWREATYDETRKKIAHCLRAKGNSQNVAQDSMHNVENKNADEPKLELDDLMEYFEESQLDLFDLVNVAFD